MTEYRLGRSIALLVPFYRRIKKKREEIFSNKNTHNNGNSSDSKSCCFPIMAIIENFL